MLKPGLNCICALIEVYCKKSKPISQFRRKKQQSLASTKSAELVCWAEKLVKEPSKKAPHSPASTSESAEQCEEQRELREFGAGRFCTLLGAHVVSLPILQWGLSRTADSLPSSSILGCVWIQYHNLIHVLLKEGLDGIKWCLFPLLFPNLDSMSHFCHILTLKKEINCRLYFFLCRDPT